jgi:hypothetical protein
MNSKRTQVLVLLLLMWTVGGAAFGQTGTLPAGRRGTALIPLTDVEKATMIHMREEEKLARDVYIMMYEFWGDAIFSNISVSEQRHMDAILQLLVKYGVPDPAAGSAVGVFGDLGLQKLYTDLVSQGQLSLLDACLVGRAIEELDITDLLKAIDETDKADLERVYSNLLNGSYHHLRAFNFHIDNLQ